MTASERDAADATDATRGIEALSPSDQPAPAARAAVAVIILTYNEEENVAHALESVCGWAKEVFVFDSFSTDRTLDVAARFPCVVVQHRFEDYAKQRKAALERLPITTPWVFFLDADEQMPAALRDEVAAIVRRDPPENGFFCRFRLIWMGRWIRRGYYGTWIMRFFRRDRARMESRKLAEHFDVEPPVGYLENDIHHEDHKGIAAWIEKHNRYSTGEALALLEAAPDDDELPARLLGTQTERKRWLRHRVWNKLPPLVRPSVYFTYRYLGRGGFLEGKEALAYHFLQALWFQMLVDIKYLELRARRKR